MYRFRRCTVFQSTGCPNMLRVERWTCARIASWFWTAMAASMIAVFGKSAKVGLREVGGASLCQQCCYYARYPGRRASDNLTCHGCQTEGGRVGESVDLVRLGVEGEVDRFNVCPLLTCLVDENERTVGSVDAARPRPNLSGVVGSLATEGSRVLPPFLESRLGRSVFGLSSGRALAFESKSEAS
jgi:hypothetical protein